MKNMKILFLVIVMMVFVQSCYRYPAFSTDFIKTTTLSFSAIESSQVELFFSKLPNRDYEEIGLIKLYNGKRIANLDDLKVTAAKMGANAVIQIRSNPYMNGIAIRWK